MSSPAGSTSSSSHQSHYHSGAEENFPSSSTTPETYSHFPASFKQMHHHNIGPRRSSTPAQSFLPPRFFGSNPHEAVMASAQAHDHAQGSTSPQPGAFPPRRTSFGNALSGRLGALSSLRGGPHPWASSTLGSQHLQHQNAQHVTTQHKSDNSAIDAGEVSSSSRPSSTTPSASTSPAFRPAAAAPLSGEVDTADLGSSTSKSSLSKQQPVQHERRHFCVPDGCGGFITMERKSRHGRAA